MVLTPDEQKRLEEYSSKMGYSSIGEFVKSAIALRITFYNNFNVNTGRSDTTEEEYHIAMPGRTYTYLVRNKM